MDISTIYSVLALGFGLGLLHALDADHVMAVSMLAANKDKRPKRFRVADIIAFCSKWAIGHGGVLILLTLALIMFGAQLPPSVSHFAEKLVGLLLIALGGWLLWNLYSQRIHLHAHDHDGVTHVHLSHQKDSHHTHQPVLIGITHGLAGSAPVLALIPALDGSHGSAWLGLIYVMMFSLGVLIAMMVFGVFFSRLQNWLIGMGQRIYQLGRLLMALCSVGFGTYWLLG